MAPSPSLPAAAPGASVPGAAVDRLLEVVAALRRHCAWTAALTHESLLAYLIEESYELAEVVEAGPGEPDAAELKGELADILYQVLLHARLAEERGAFALADVADHLSAKLIRRNGHVFRPDGSLQDHFPDSIAEIERSYAAAKAAERAVAAAEVGGDAGLGAAGPDAGSDASADAGAGERSAAAGSPFATLPSSMPALALAAKTLERAEVAGLQVAVASTGAAGTADNPGAPHGAAVRGSTAEAGNPALDALAAAGAPQTEDELGELLFAVVRSARAHGLDAERALRTAIRRVHAAG